MKRILALALSAAIAISSATIVLAQEQQPLFMSLTGEVTEITEPAYGDGSQSIIHIQTEESSALFLTNDNTYVLGEEVAVGNTITGYYLANAPMVMIYPPQYTVQLIVNGEFNNVKLDRFTVSENVEDAMVSYDGMLQINLGNLNTEDGTKLILQDGQVFEIESLEELNNRKLVVVYDISTRSIPAITTPSLVVVLFELAVHPIATIDPGMIASLEQEDEEEDYTAWEDDAVAPLEFSVNDGILINGEVLEGADWEQIVSEEHTFIYVPVRAVAEALGATVTWDYDNYAVSIQTGDNTISFGINSTEFTLNGEVLSIENPPQPALLINERTYVPLRFFRDVFGMNNAYMHAGQVVIDNEEPMQ